MVGRLFPLHDRFVSGVDALVDLFTVSLAPLYKGIVWVVAIGIVLDVVLLSVREACGLA